MAITPNNIRQDYYQFRDPGIFNDRIINKYIALATARLNPIRWQSQLDYGVELFVAHYLTLKERNDRVARMGGIPGEVKGPLTSRSVGEVSQSWDSSVVALDNGGFWNSSIYGIEFLQLARIFGMGAIQL